MEKSCVPFRLLNAANLLLSQPIQVRGGTGTDTFISGPLAVDFLYKGKLDGADLFSANGAGVSRAIAEENDTIIGVYNYNNGIDEFVGYGSNTIIGSDVNHGTLNFSNTTLTNIKEIDAGGGDDTVTASTISPASYRGNLGRDTLNAGSGNVAVTWLYSGTPANSVDTFTGNGSGVVIARAETDNTVIGVYNYNNGVDEFIGYGSNTIIGSDVNHGTLNFSATVLANIQKVDAGSGNDTVTTSPTHSVQTLYDGGANTDSIALSFTTPQYAALSTAPSLQGNASLLADVLAYLASPTGKTLEIPLGTGGIATFGFKAMNFESGTKTITNFAPTGLSLSNTSIAENAGDNAAVGDLLATDPDSGDAFTYSLVTGSGSADNSSFNISGNQLRANHNLDYENKGSYTIRVRATDIGGAMYERSFSISVTNVNEAPTISGVSFDNISPKTNDVLTAQVVGSNDAEDDLIVYRYVWYVNGISVRDVNSYEDSDWLDLSKIGNGDKGDTIFVSATPMDSSNVGSATDSSEATVVNSAPVALDTQVYLEAYNRSYQGIAFLANAYDPDGDAISHEMIVDPTGGSLVFSSSEVYDYLATANGIDNFSFRYTDGMSYSANVSCKVLAYDDTTNFATDSWASTFETLNYAAFNGAPNGMTIGQGQLNDCWLVAPAVGLAQAQAAGRAVGLITNMIVDGGPDAGGGRIYTVTFPGHTPRSFVYNPGETFANPADATKPFSFATSTNNDDWMGILEKAYAFDQAPTAATWSDSISQVLGSGRVLGFGTKAITNHTVDVDDTWCTRDSTTRAALVAAFAANKLVEAGAARANFGIVQKHCYTVLEFDAVNDRVRVRNPWGHNQALVGGVLVNATSYTTLEYRERQFGQPGGYVTVTHTRCAATDADFWMPLTDFTRAFSSISYEE